MSNKDELSHYGIKRRSGRYPWGSGKNAYQRMKTFQSTVKDLKKKGMSESEIAKSMNLTTNKLRARISIAADEIRKADIARTHKLKEKGYSNVKIGEMIGVPESTIRNYLKDDLLDRTKATQKNAEILKKQCLERGPLDVGSGVERHMGISRTKLNVAVESLREQGFNVYDLKTEQLGTGKYTTVHVLAPPDADYATVSRNRDKIRIPNVYSEDGGETIRAVENPKSISSKRVKIVYAEDGGTDKDGLIELRRGVDDISLGKARYAQVRIAVDGTHYIKGMAMYSDDLPEGCDIRFNTNKKRGTPMISEDKDHSVLKPMKTLSNGEIDNENPFGATIKMDHELLLTQRHYKDKSGKEQLSALNIVNEEGDWSRWSRNLPSQFLSKQYPFLAKRQLSMAYKSKEEEFEEIQSLNNPIIKQKLLMSFANECDSSSVHLKAAALPRQQTHVILPFKEIKDTEIYAPNYQTGERVALVRYPHGGIFEIPTLTVNNNLAKPLKTIGKAPDAVGINSKVAEQLSGADFDGDSVVVIPLRNQKIKTSPPLEKLKGFDPKKEYPGYEGMPRMTKAGKQKQMGQVTNLITDMTVRGADEEKICRAVKHSMVIIDAEKHNLNWRKSAIENNIADLKREFQGGANKGASTLISKASAEYYVPSYKEKINSDGSISFVETGKTRKYKNGEEKPTLMKTTRMAREKDAYNLSSGTTIENIYADHANKLKSLANEARKSAISINPYPISKSAAATYNKEVQSLKNKLAIAEKNAPLERRAQMLANKKVSIRIQDEPDMEADKKKKIRGQELTRARIVVGAKKDLVPITDREWEAIQAHAISAHTLKKIMDNTDLDKLKERATPRNKPAISPAKLAIAKTRLKAGYEKEEVAQLLGVSVTTLNKYIMA